MLSVYLHITAWLHKSKKVEQHLVMGGGGGWQKVCLQMKYFLDVEKKSFLYNFLCERIIINKDIYHYFNSYLIRKKTQEITVKVFRGPLVWKHFSFFCIQMCKPATCTIMLTTLLCQLLFYLINRPSDHVIRW